MSGLRSSQNHQWLTSDMLGQGATGGVYRGWRIDTGASVAVKTFNTVGLQRPSHVHNREFDILRAISHPNIVQMFAVEEEERSKESVIVMEICTGGSLYNVLEEPQYIYGLREEHLLRLISDVTNGMSYLREKVNFSQDSNIKLISRRLSIVISNQATSYAPIARQQRAGSSPISELHGSSTKMPSLW